MTLRVQLDSVLICFRPGAYLNRMRILVRSDHTRTVRPYELPVRSMTNWIIYVFGPYVLIVDKYLSKRVITLLLS